MICLLGRPRADAAVARGHKPWAITAYLALADGPVSRDRLIALLFEDADDPAGALRWNLGQVRRLLGRPDALRGRVLSLRDTDVAFDVDLLTRGRWQDAVELPTSAANCSKACSSRTARPTKSGCWVNGAASPRPPRPCCRKPR